MVQEIDPELSSASRSSQILGLIQRIYELENKLVIFQDSQRLHNIIQEKDEVQLI